jgi:hypothetical protein
MLDKPQSWIRSDFRGNFKNPKAEAPMLARCLAYGIDWAVFAGPEDAKEFLRKNASVITRSSNDGTLTADKLANLLCDFASSKGLRVASQQSTTKMVAEPERNLFAARHSLAARTSEVSPTFQKSLMSDEEYLGEAAAYGRAFNLFESRPEVDFVQFADRFLGDQRRQDPSTSAFETFLQVYAEYVGKPRFR